MHFTMPRDGTELAQMLWSNGESGVCTTLRAVATTQMGQFNAARRVVLKRSVCFVVGPQRIDSDTLSGLRLASQPFPAHRGAWESA